MVVAIAGEIKAREEGLKGRVAIDEGGNMGGAVFHEGAKRQNKEREEHECDKV